MGTLFFAIGIGIVLGTALSLFLYVAEHPLGIIPRFVWVEVAAGVLLAFGIVLTLGDESFGFLATVQLFAAAFIGLGIPNIIWQTWLYPNNQDRRLS